MKTELIAMRPPVYTSTGTSVPPQNEFSASSQHPLELFAEDQLTITNTFLRHLAQCRLSQRRFQIVLTIFNQTVGFHKFEDDMNGTRLQQLTGLLPNHANATVRELAQLNVLVIRKGHYGHYLAINFNFSQWGQKDSDEKATINPCYLLPDNDADTDDIATALSTDSMDEEVTVEHGVKPVITPETTTLQQTDAVSVNHIEQDQEQFKPTQWVRIEDLHTLLQPLVDRLDELSNKIEQLKTPVKTAINDTLVAKPAEKTITIESPISPQQKQPHTPTSANIPLAKQQPTKSIKTTTTPLRCPPTLSPQKHAEARMMVSKAGDQAQMLLDMLNQRMQNTSDPLRSPIAYLESLVQKLQAGGLTFPTTSTTTTALPTTGPIQPAKPSIAVSCEEEYREARADRLQMENNIRLLAKSDQLSFSEVLVKLGLDDLWEGVTARFSQAKVALEALQGEGQVVVV